MTWTNWTTAKPLYVFMHIEYFFTTKVYTYRSNSSVFQLHLKHDCKQQCTNEQVEEAHKQENIAFGHSVNRISLKPKYDSFYHVTGTNPESRIMIPPSDYTWRIVWMIFITLHHGLLMSFRALHNDKHVYI